MKNHGKQRKQAKKEKNKSQVSDLLGPKSFSLDRLLAIFYAIMEEKASLTVNLMSQVNVTHFTFKHSHYIFAVKILVIFILISFTDCISGGTSFVGQSRRRQH